MPSRNFTINGIRHRLHFWGSPKLPKLFLIHGWMDMGMSFNFLCEKLQKKFYCIAPDLRGFGESAHVRNPLGYHFNEYVADVHGIFNRLAPDESLKVLGHSMGGNILSLYAGIFPERVSHFVNVEGFGIADMPPASGPERMLKWISDSTERQRFKIYPDLKSLAVRLKSSNPRLRMDRALFLARHLSRRIRGGYRIAADTKHKMASPYLFQLKNIYPYWESIRARCLLVTGADTEMGTWLNSPADLQTEISARLSHFPAGSRQITIAGSGHMVHHEKPGELARVMLDFLAMVI